MTVIEKEISYIITNSYSTLNELTKNTKNIWFVCHGMGYLSRYFLKYFKELNSDENYFVAPQAQSKYYIQPEFKHVGASWLTKENTLKETQNVMTYFDSVFEAEHLANDKRLIIVGYSQGVSVAMRYVASRKIDCKHLVLMSGGIPKELKKEDFNHLNGEITFIYGNEDEYINDERMAYEHNRGKELFGDNAKITEFDGNHMVNVDLINALV
jgi:predicted esterase